MSEINQKPPARSIFRMLSVVIAAINYMMAVVAALGLVDKDGKLFNTMIFLFVGFVFTTIAIEGHWPPRAMQDGKPVPVALTPQIFMTLGIFCLIILLMGVGGLISGKPHGFIEHILNGSMVFFGSIGVVSSIVAFLEQRRKQDEESK